MDKKTIKAYDKFAEHYANHTFEIIPQYNLYQFINFLKGRNVLDVGCGSGRDIKYLVEEGFNVIGIDASENMVRQAKKNAKKGRFMVMDIEAKLGFADESVDGIWCCDSLTHVQKKNIQKVIKEFYRVLKKDGVLFVSVREGEYDNLKIMNELGMEKVHVSEFTQPEIESLLLNSEFELLATQFESSQQATWINVFARKN
ncbi:class I SAM-dependent methyltransferase [Candidatus Woesearchaeota archaeon]|nr:MAG: class I SAM-dependent methyltransferase [Candidatus Woesearchaeota archaeon]